MCARISKFFLENYRNETLLIQQKTKTLLFLILFVLFIFSPALVLFLIFSPYKDMIIYPLSVSAGLLLSLCLLKKGMHALSGQLLIVSLLAAITAASIEQVMTPGAYINKLAVVFFTMGFISILPIVIRRYFAVIFFYSFFAFVITSIYLHLIRIKAGLAFMDLIPVYLTITLGFLLSSFSCLMFFKSSIDLSKKQKANEKKYRDLYENAMAGMATISCPDGIIQKMNEAALNIVEVSRDSYHGDIMGKKPISYFYNFSDEEGRLLKKIKNLKEINNIEIPIKKTDNTWSWIEISARYDEGRECVETIFKDITYRKTAEENLHRLTFYDNLTSLPNREMFINRVQIEMIKSLRKHKKTIFAVMCLGIDHFKKINEMHGTLFGDMVLKYIAEKLRAIIRDDDVISRYEGDKFQILFSDLASSDDVIEIVKKTMTPFNDEIELEGILFNLTASMGICFYPSDGDDPIKLLKNSETAMFTAKARGRNQYQVFNNDLNNEILEKIHLEQELLRAIKNNEFVPFFQPKVNNKGTLLGMESLVRWQSPSRGMVSPFHFIPLAERNGMINEIGRQMLRQSCLTMKEWRDRGLKDVRVAVNISPTQFRQKDLVEMVEATLQETELPPLCLELEITESGIMENEKEAIHKLRALHDMGISISIDDFGTGYSSLSKLKDYPIDTVKIDKSFIDNLPGESRAETITTTIIDLAHNLGFKVVAEGIESIHQLSFLEERLCDQYQGYYFNRPLPSREFESFYQIYLNEEKENTIEIT